MRFIYIAAIFLIACQHEQKQTEQTSSEKSYFDILKVVQNDIDNNTKNNCGEEKNVFINTTNETKTKDTVDWKKELQTLIECDINKPSWKGKFTTQILNNQQKYVYVSNSSKIPIRKMTVNFEKENGKVSSIIIDKKTATFLFSNEQQITYYPEQSVKISAKQSAMFMKDFNSEVEIKFHCNH